jgi:glutaredoxin 3
MLHASLEGEGKIFKMKHAEIYTARFCPYCAEAKAILKALNLSIRETDISGNWEARDEMISRANGQTKLPQIFIDAHHIGSIDELREMKTTLASH